jgi:hypothetical protein
VIHLRVLVVAALALVLAGGSASAQPEAASPPVSASAQPAAAAPPAEKSWSIAASAATYILPDSADYVQPVMTADRGWLHLEGRFNYEDLDTGSAWFGYNISVGKKVTLELTPMVGAVFGNTDGVAPGFRGALSWGMLDLSSETEYVFDTAHAADSFFYTWSEAGVAPVEWCRVGVVIQRTKIDETEFEIERGAFAGVSYKRADITAYVFNLRATRPTVVVGVGVQF